MTRLHRFLIFTYLLFTLFHSLSHAKIFWEGCESESDHPKIVEGNFYNLCILDHVFDGDIHSWMFTKAVVKRTVFKNAIFQNRERAPNNFTEAVWEDVAFENCEFGSLDVRYGPQMIFDNTRMTNVEFKNTLFHHSVETVFDKFKLENVSFINCSFTGNTIFSLGTITNVRIHQSNFAYNINTMSQGSNMSLYFKQCTINSLNLLDNHFKHPTRFESVDARDVTFNNSIFDEFYCHGINEERRNQVIEQSRFNESAMDECTFNGPVVCDETTWNGFYAANVTFNHDADFSRSKIENIYWDGIRSRLDESNPECRVLNFSQSEIDKNTIANISIDCEALFQQTSFHQVRVKNFFAKKADFDSAIFNEQEYIDSNCCSVVCEPLKCKCNVTDPSGLCKAAEWPVNVSALRPICFPGDASVKKLGGQVITMKELELKEKIAIGNNKYSDIFFFGHRNIEERTQFIQITHSGCDNNQLKPLKISASHYLYVNGQLQNANSIKIGDKLRDINGMDKLIVQKIEKIYGIGTYAPTSLHGDLLVDGVIVSSYTDALHPNLAHRLLHPLRLMYKAGWYNIVSRFTMFERRSWSNIARVLRIPQGPAIVVHE